MNILHRFSSGKKNGVAFPAIEPELDASESNIIPVEFLSAIDDMEFQPGDLLDGDATYHGYGDDEASIAETGAEQGEGRSATAHTRTRLAALAEVDGSMEDFQSTLKSIEESLTQVHSIYSVARDFLDSAHADLRRANELENLNAQLQDEIARLIGRAEDAEGVSAQMEAAIDGHTKREANLRTDIDRLRAQLTEMKSRAAESERAVVRAQTERTEMEKRISVSSSLAERLQGENDGLRQKQVNQAFELEKSQKHAVEYRRKFDELSAIYESESNRLSEVLARNSELESDLMRLNREKELASGKLAEAEETIRSMESDRLDEDSRHLAEVNALEEEVKTLTARLDVCARELEDQESANVELRSELSSAKADKHVADQKLKAMAAERDAARRDLMSTNSRLAEATLLHESDRMELEAQIQKSDGLHKEVMSLVDRVKKLAPYERLYHLSKTRLGDIATEAKIVLAEHHRAERETRTRIKAPELACAV